MNRLIFGRGRAPQHRRPVVCTECGKEVMSGVGEPEYGLHDGCRMHRGTRAMTLTNRRHKNVPVRRRL